MAAMAVLVATLGALAWSALLGYLTLAARRFRNARLFARGEPGMKDCAFPRAIVGIGAAFGAAASGVAMLMSATWTVTIVSAAVAASPPFVLMIGAALVGAFPRRDG